MRPPMKGGNLTRSFFFRPIWMTATRRCWVTFMDLAFQHEALDVFYAPIQMKKHRPGVLLNVLVASEQADAMRRLILLHTSAFGVRSTLWDRKKLQRKAGQIPTVYGPIATKEGVFGRAMRSMHPGV